MVSLILKWLSENYLFWLMPFVLYAAYWLRYRFKKKPLHTGDYDNLVADLLDSVGRDAAIERIDPDGWRGLKRISFPGYWRERYDTLLKGLLGFLDRWFGEGWWNPRALHVCYLLAFVYPVLSVFGSWLITGAGQIGVMDVFPSIDSGWWRLFMGGILALFFWLALMGYFMFLSVSEKLADSMERHSLTKRPSGLMERIAFLGTPLFAAAIVGLVFVHGAIAGFGTVVAVLTFAFVFASMAERIKQDREFLLSGAYLLQSFSPPWIWQGKHVTIGIRKQDIFFFRQTRLG